MMYLQRHARRKLSCLLLQVRGLLGGVSRRGADEVDHRGAILAFFGKLRHIADLNHWHHMHGRWLHAHLGLHMPARTQVNRVTSPPCSLGFAGWPCTLIQGCMNLDSGLHWS